MIAAGEAKPCLGFYISDRKFVLMEFLSSQEDGVAALADIVSRAELTLSNPALAFLCRVQPPPIKRKYISSLLTTSTISSSDRHQQKRNDPAGPTDSGDSSTLSPTLPSSIPEQPAALLSFVSLANS